MSLNGQITKENLDALLKEVAREYNKRTRGGMKAEIILVGGAAVLANYGFREMTNDIDAIVDAESVMNDVIRDVGDRFQLPSGWLNADFKKTNSYSWKLIQYSTHYRTYSNVLEIRTVRAEYLVAMKLKAGRMYKKDLSDVVGILNEQQKAQCPLSYDMIDRAMRELYGGWEGINAYCKDLLRMALDSGNLANLFEETAQQEYDAKEAVLEIQQKHEVIINEDNISDIIAQALEKKRLQGE